MMLLQDWQVGQFCQGLKGAPPNSRPPSPLPTSSEIRSSDSLRTPFSGARKPTGTAASCFHGSSDRDANRHDKQDLI